MCQSSNAIKVSAVFVAFIFLWCPSILVAKNLYVDANRGNDTHPGTLGKPLKTIQQAVKVMASGDTCTIREGVYRETVTPTKDGLTFKNYKNEYVLITGLDVITGWESYKNGIMQAPSNEVPDFPDEKKF